MNKLLFFFVMLAPIFALAQGPEFPTAKVQEKMKVLANWAGQWEGEGWFFVEGKRELFTQSEDIKLTLDGTLLAIEGKGFAMDDPSQMIHHAIALISYDPFKDIYSMNSFTMEGQKTNASFEVMGTDEYKWYFNVPGGTITFFINFKDGKWNEKGYFNDGNGNEYNFLEMNLTKL